MLTHLQLRNFVIVEEAEIEFSAGMTALTGETGAGKSIVVDALALIAGGRASADVVRQGADRAEAAAGFDALPEAATAWLDEQSIDHDGEVLLRRVVSLDGRSRAYVNGHALPLQSLRDFAEFLIEIHGQQEFLHLVSRDMQRLLLDEHGGAAAQAGAVAERFAHYRDCREEHRQLQAAAAGRDARLDLLRHQVAELRSHATSGAVIEALFLERARIAGRGRLAEASRTALDAVYESDAANANDLLAKAQTALRGAGDADPALSEAGRFLAEASINVREAAAILRPFLDALDVDPARQDDIERRAAAVEALARKHRIEAALLPGRLEELERELDLLDNSELKFADLERRLQAAAEEYRAAAARLSAIRRVAAEDLGQQITALMQSLGMIGGRFEVQVTARPGEISIHGSDEVEFLVSANPGQAPKALAKVASGGELSRIGLAVQVAAAAQTGAPCLVFDEVDTGIGGAIAEIVGLQLRALGERGQVLCVTHLPQVASQAHHQFRVTKHNDGKLTRTTLQALDAVERVDEIARMLGGIDITAQARAHASDMLNRGLGSDAGKSRKARGKRA